MMRRNFKILMAMLLLVLGVMGFTQTYSVKAATNSNIVIDGNFSDWASVPKVKSTNGSEVAMVVADNYLYYYISVNPTGSRPAGKWTTPEFPLNEAFKLQVGNRHYDITPVPVGNRYQSPQTPGQKIRVDMTVGNSSSFNNAGDNDGYVSAVGVKGKDFSWNNVFEGKVDLSDLELANGSQQYTLSGTIRNIGTYTTTASYDYQQNNGGDYTGHPNIVIDGAFDDWADVTKTKLRNSNTDYNVHQGALLQSDGNLYLYINMDPHRGASYDDFQAQSYYFSVGGKERLYNIVQPDKSSFRPLTHVGDTEAVVLKDNGDQQTIVSGSTGYVTRLATNIGGHTDVLEMKIPVKSLAGSATDGQEITFRNPALGNQTMTVTGGSTGPILLAAGGFGIALFGLWQFNRRKKRAEEQLS